MTNAAVGTDRYTVAQTSAVDVEEWYKVDVTQHLFVCRGGAGIG